MIDYIDKIVLTRTCNLRKLRQPSEGHFVSVATKVLCFILNCQQSQTYQN